MPFWWDRLLQDEAFVSQLKDRWFQLREAQLDENNIFNENENWLTSYALFSFFRDKYKTVDFTKWGNYSVFNPTFLTDFIPAL